MRKSDKKTDNNIRKTLTNVCEIALEQVDGFKWLTHFVNYDNFPESLVIVCVFDTKSDLAKARVTKQDEFLISLIVDSLLNEGIKLRDARQAVTLDRKSTRLNSSHVRISYAVFCLKKKK